MSKVYIYFTLIFVFHNTGYSSEKYPLPDFILNVKKNIEKNNSCIVFDSTFQVNLNNRKLNVLSIELISEFDSINEELNSLLILLKELNYKEQAYNLLFTLDDRLIGVFPSTETSKNTNKRRYINLSEFYISFNTLKSKKWKKWRKNIDEVKELDSNIKAYCSAFNLNFNLDLMHKKSYNRKVWTKVLINEKDTTVKLSEIDLFSLEKKDVKSNFRTECILFPILPSVFSPSREDNLEDEQLIAELYYKSLHRLNLVDLKTLLEVGTGTGYYLWIAHKFAEKNNLNVSLFGIDINPIAVDNAKILSRIGAFKVDVIKHNNISDKDGAPSFHDISFDYIVWNMPQVPQTLADSIVLNEVEFKDIKSHQQYWDSGVNGINALARFAKNLPTILDIKGKALIWNSIPDSGIDVVKNTFEYYNFNITSLDKHYSEKYKETTIIYELTHNLK